MPLELTVYFAETAQQLEDAHFIRNEVFVKEQGIPLPIEQDSYEEESRHIVAYHQDKPIAAGRIRIINSTVAKVDQISVLPNYRLQQVGVRMMQVLEEYALNNPESNAINTIVVYAQAHAVPFYERQNYQITSPEFIDGGAAYRAMEKKLIR